MKNECCIKCRDIGTQPCGVTQFGNTTHYCSCHNPQEVKITPIINPPIGWLKHKMTCTKKNCEKCLPPTKKVVKESEVKEEVKWCGCNENIENGKCKHTVPVKESDWESEKMNFDLKIGEVVTKEKIALILRWKQIFEDRAKARSRQDRDNEIKQILLKNVIVIDGFGQFIKTDAFHQIFKNVV